jgi:hypothetical protein
MRPYFRTDLYRAKRIVGFKASTEGNLVGEKEQNMFLFYQKNTIISYGLYGI